MGGHHSLRSVPLRSFLPRQKIFRLRYNCGGQASGKPYSLPFYCVDTAKPSVAKASSFAQGYGGGYDRGHLAPAADMAFSVQTMADSFFISNMSPQKPAYIKTNT